EELARKTLNARLGIVGGISILGTTGIVKPLSAEAWTATVISSMDVAKATGCRELVLSAGRASERAHMETFNLPVEAYVMMGDYLEFPLVEAKYHRFERVHLCAQWAKMLKIAMATPQTHVRHGALDTERTVAFLKGHGTDVSAGGPFNTAREIFEYLGKTCTDPREAWMKICSAAQKYAQGLTGGIPVPTHLVSYDGKILLTLDDNDKTGTESNIMGDEDRA
ncbi:MAG TPA: cobalt-precorrin-5B (C(1))-methyltransferase, partial [Dissulfurispiraceae bacterium]|nr:cobalt-precorrin-5B (C(1))-methyltransferase [Dissulfurispiraceae bacterium]